MKPNTHGRSATRHVPKLELKVSAPCSRKTNLGRHLVPILLERTSPHCEHLRSVSFHYSTRASLTQSAEEIAERKAPLMIPMRARAVKALGTSCPPSTISARTLVIRRSWLIPWVSCSLSGRCNGVHARNQLARYRALSLREPSQGIGVRGGELEMGATAVASVRGWRARQTSTASSVTILKVRVRPSSLVITEASSTFDGSPFTCGRTTC